MENILIYEATYRTTNIFAEGFIILTDNYVEGVFARDYMAIYNKNTNIITISLYSESFEIIKIPFLQTGFAVESYNIKSFSMVGNMLHPGQNHIYFSDNNLDDLYLNISSNIVQGEDANDILNQLYELRNTFKIK